MIVASTPWLVYAGQSFDVWLAGFVSDIGNSGGNMWRLAMGVLERDARDLSRFRPRMYRGRDRWLLVGSCLRRLFDVPKSATWIQLVAHDRPARDRIAVRVYRDRVTLENGRTLRIGSDTMFAIAKKVKPSANGQMVYVECWYKEAEMIIAQTPWLYFHVDCGSWSSKSGRWWFCDAHLYEYFDVPSNAKRIRLVAYDRPAKYRVPFFVERDWVIDTDSARVIDTDGAGVDMDLDTKCAIMQAIKPGDQGQEIYVECEYEEWPGG